MGDAAREIENLLHRYAERMDAGDLEGVADLFEHGAIKPTPDAPLEQSIVGRERVLALYQSSARLYEDGLPHTKHVTTNSIIEVDEAAGTATARSYYTVFQQVDDFPLQPIIAGRYHDCFRRIEGRWWFEARVMHVDLKGDLSRHLLYTLD